MKKTKQDAKGILSVIRGLFSGEVNNPIAEPVKPAKGTFAGVTAAYNVTGAAPVYVDISDDNLPGIEQGDNVYADQAETTAYPDGTYTVDTTQFSFTVVAGVVTLVVDPAGTGAGTPVQAAAPAVAAPAAAAAPGVPVPPIVAAPAAAAPVPPIMPRFATVLPADFGAFRTAFASDKEDTVKLDTEKAYTDMLTIVSKFATGTTEERIGGLETMVKALMQYAYGYELQRIDQQTAISTYKTTIDGLQLQMSKQEKQITDYKAAGEKMVTLFEEFLEIPVTEPITVSEKDKAKFEQQDKKDARIKEIAEALKNNRKNK